MARYDDNGQYSLANQLEVLVNPRWEALKDRGNEALKAGEVSAAIMWYKRAEALTDVNTAVTAFFKVLGAAAGSTAAACLAGAETDLRGAILSFLPDGPRAIVPFDADGVKQAAARGEPEEGTEPNLPRAVCHANTAAALLKAGKPEAALEEALNATAWCPEYLKGYHRQLSAWKALGRASEAAALTQDLDKMGLMRGQMAWGGINCLCLGWVGSLCYEQIYGPAYFRHECAKIAQLKPMPLTVLASLVPLGGGQWLTIGLGYHSLGASMIEGGSPQRRHDCMHMAQLDAENSDIVELPPHGRASRASAERFPGELIKFLRKLRGEKIEPTHLTLGQGLTVFGRSIRKKLKAAGFGAVATCRASVTHASKVQEMGVEAACGLELDEHGDVVGLTR